MNHGPLRGPREHQAHSSSRKVRTGRLRIDRWLETGTRQLSEPLLELRSLASRSFRSLKRRLDKTPRHERLSRFDRSSPVRMMRVSRSSELSALAPA